MAKSQMLFYKATRPPEWPFNVVVKRHGNKTIIYITYGGGRKTGGGAWSENLANVHPRTMNMVKDYFDQDTVDNIMALLNTDKRRNHNKTNRGSTKDVQNKPTK